jgi:hypothetical protein
VRPSFEGVRGIAASSRLCALSDQQVCEATGAHFLLRIASFFDLCFGS